MTAAGLPAGFDSLVSVFSGCNTEGCGSGLGGFVLPPRLRVGSGGILVHLSIRTERPELHPALPSTVSESYAFGGIRMALVSRVKTCESNLQWPPRMP